MSPQLLLLKVCYRWEFRVVLDIFDQTTFENLWFFAFWRPKRVLGSFPLSGGWQLPHYPRHRLLSLAQIAVANMTPKLSILVGLS